MDTQEKKVNGIKKEDQDKWLCGSKRKGIKEVRWREKERLLLEEI